MHGSHGFLFQKKADGAEKTAKPKHFMSKAKLFTGVAALSLFMAISPLVQGRAQEKDSSRSKSGEPCFVENDSSAVNDSFWIQAPRGSDDTLRPFGGNSVSTKKAGFGSPMKENVAAQENKGRVSVSGSTITVSLPGQDTSISFGKQLMGKFGFSEFPANTIVESSSTPSGQKMFFILAPGSTSIIAVYKSAKTHMISATILDADCGMKMGENPVYTLLPKGGIFAVAENFTLIYFDQSRAFSYRLFSVFDKFGPLDKDAKASAFYEDGELMLRISSKNLKDGSIVFLPRLLALLDAGN
jgi:hypothetical protein